MEKDSYFVRVYAKNQMYTGKHIATKLWVGDYTTGDTFEKFAQKAEGIKRIGVLRADVDNLGQTFVAGFAGKYATLSRTAALSRQLSIFFKYYIRSILKNGEYHIDGEKKLTELYPQYSRSRLPFTVRAFIFSSNSKIGISSTALIPSSLR